MSEPTDAWLQRVSSALREQVGPEQAEQIRVRAASMQRAQSLAGRAKRMSRATSLSESWFASSSLKQSPSARPSLRLHDRVGATSAPTAAADLSMVAEMSEEDEEEAEQLQRRSLVDSMQQNAGLQQTLSMLSPAPMAASLPRVRSLEAVAVEEAALAEAADAALDTLEEELRSSAAAPAGAGDAAPLTGIDALLPELRDEPSDDTERAAKFALYEKFLETVEHGRGEALALWEASRLELPPAVAGSMAVEVQRLDAPTAIGLDDSLFGGRIWFVQPMCRAAAKNNQTTARLLSSINTKLELIARQQDCPICLESIEEGQEKTLACCHKTCSACWAQWSAVRGGAPFCPLCRHADFLTEVLSAADRRATASE